jgi:hypothetical protein
MRTPWGCKLPLTNPINFAEEAQPNRTLAQKPGTPCGIGNNGPTDPFHCIQQPSALETLTRAAIAGKKTDKVPHAAAVQPVLFA